MNVLIDLGEAGSIHGICDEKFQPVLDNFVANFRDREERGASVCLNVEGETVVDLWGGKQHPKQDADWQEDTVSVVVIDVGRMRTVIEQNGDLR